MKRQFSRLKIIALYTLLICWVTGAAGADDDHDKARKLRESGNILPLETILERARTHKSGRLLEVELETRNKLIIYEVEILDTQGIVWEMKFDARNGKLLEMEKED